MGVHDRGYGLVVDLPGAPGHPLGDRDSFGLGLVGQHRSGHEVADSPDALDIGAALRVNQDLSSLVDCHAHVF